MKKNSDLESFKRCRISGHETCFKYDVKQLVDFLTLFVKGMSSQEIEVFAKGKDLMLDVLESKLTRKCNEINAAESHKDVDKNTWGSM